MDKGYYDYDFEQVKPKRELTEEQKEIWSKDKLMSVLGRAIDPKTGRNVFELNPLTAEDMQKAAASELNKQKRGN